MFIHYRNSCLVFPCLRWEAASPNEALKLNISVIFFHQDSVDFTLCLFHEAKVPQRQQPQARAICSLLLREQILGKEHSMEIQPAYELLDGQSCLIT